MGPGDGVWSDLPPMVDKRFNSGCCVLPSGRVAVIAGVGGEGDDEWGYYCGEMFDLEARTWQPLPPMAHERYGHAVVTVAGGLLAVGGMTEGEDGSALTAPNELFNEASGRWFELPHPMAEPRSTTAVVSLPAAALAPPAAAGAAAAAQ